MIIGWKAWYVNSDHTALVTYESSNTAFGDLPKDRCLGFVLFEDRKTSEGKSYKTNLSGYDYYFHADPDIYGVDIEVRERNILEEIKARYTNPIIIRGIWTTDDLMRQVLKEMAEVDLLCR